MFGLVVRFRLRDAGSAEAFDRLVAETVEQITALEPGTLVYTSHKIEGEPLVRVFYELYRDRDAFDAHEHQEHTRRFLETRALYVESFEVEWLTLQTGKASSW